MVLEIELLLEPALDLIYEVQMNGLGLSFQDVWFRCLDSGVC